LGPVLEEAAHTAVSFVRSKSEQLHLAPDWIKDIDLHVHIPRARAARDFAGMGSAIFCAVCSLLLGASCRSDVAVLGELTLRGTVLPVRGIKSMLLGAHRAGVRTVVLPARNEPDVAEVPSDILDDLQIRYVHRLDELLPLILVEPDSGNPRTDPGSPSALHP
jgi:ATP-dependent Lon protease